MRVFAALLKKEFNSCLKNGMFFGVAFVYMLVSVGVAFYFGSYLDMHDTALYALFMWQPVILVALIPALSMRTWTEEYKSGTDEFLLTLPLSDSVLVLAKWAAVFGLLSLMALGLLPFILYSASRLHLDFCNIISNFIGLELMMMALSSLGCLISSLSRQLIKTYLFSVLLMSLWAWVPSSKFYMVYKNFLFAEFGVVDVLYFVLFSGGLLILNILALSLQRATMKYKRLKYWSFAFLLILGICLCLNTVYNFFPAKLDMTSAQIYTPKQQTKTLISKLDKPVTVEIYAAEDYLQQNPENQHFFEQIARFFKKYEILSQGMINVEILPVKAFSALEENILRRGLYYSENAKGSRNYFGAFFKLRDGSETVIKQFLPQRYAYVEKDAAIALLKLIQPQNVKKKIGVYLDKQQNLQPFEAIMLNLENDYDLHKIEDNTPYISPDTDMVILVNPKKLSALFLYAIDQYIINGGKLLVFLDFYTQRQVATINEQKLSLAPFFSHWGIKFKDYLTDEAFADKAFVTNKKQLNVAYAAAFTAENEDISVKPIIYTDKGDYIGAIFSGKLNSHYTDNPFYENNPSLRWLSWHAENKAAKFALVSDVDILDEDNWVDEHTDDKNPYSLIAKAANGEILRTITDVMVGNELYIKLPINMFNNNEQNIDIQLEYEAYKPYREQLDELSDILNEMQLELYQKSGGEANLLNKMVQISMAGKSLAKTEKQIEQLQYSAKQAKIQKIYEILILQAIIIPLLLIVLSGLILWIFGERKKRKIKEMFDD
ncbi:MAG: Gldg family protein [Alphaproteobacteria bacterium]|nr:Gldg family protein [Alphaproteobacteria bacterium]